MSLLPILKKEPFCQCLYETENSLQRTKHCLTPCNEQFIILEERKKILDQVVPLIKDLEVAIENKSEATLVTGSKKLTMKELLEEIKKLTPLGRKHVDAWLKAQERLKKK